ncbi:hypothetical protein CFE70_003666 [Pyrenophora teres f. teres 0-1]|uniref:Uncharacterized protein n=1 Tax=Pyrenophora teres f. teres (strain 0-1) TaxID=861557 RepID=E3RMM1_PYRTT|nr:hypothetical protein PTT_09711 [Pyrenophora teres f. teres 0-1]
MPSPKRQKTVRDSGMFKDNSDSDSSDSAFESVRPHKSDKSDKSESKKSNDDNGKNASSPNNPAAPAPHDYICIHRPYFDVEGAEWLAWSTNPSSNLDKDEIYSKRFKPIFEQEVKDGIYKAPPSEHKDHKWVMMWGAWLKTDLLRRKSTYCEPNLFGMNLYNDWRGWGMHEIAENMMKEFDRAFRSKGDERIKKMWVVVSAVGLWLNGDDHLDAIIQCEDGDTTFEIIDLLGCSLLTALAAIEAADELKPDSCFLDLALVIAYYLELSHDVFAYGIEDKCLAWHKEAAEYFKKGNLNPNKGLFATKLRIEKIEEVGASEEETDDEDEKVTTAPETPAKGTAEDPVTIDDNVANKENKEPEATLNTRVSPPLTPKVKRKQNPGGVHNEDTDPWKWAQKFAAYKKNHHPKVGGQHYDITKMSSIDREAVAFDGKDPLAHIPKKALKGNLLDIA